LATFIAIDDGCCDSIPADTDPSRSIEAAGWIDNAARLNYEIKYSG
jgi:hypothetical protein